MVETNRHEEELLQSVALKNAASILRARQRAEQELVEAKEALRQSTERVTRILESITDGFLVLDSSWRFTYVNRKAEEMLQPLGKSRQDLLGRDLWEELPALAGTDFERAYRRAMSEQVTVEAEAYYPPLSAFFAVRAYPSADGLSIYIEDVTRRREMESKLRESEEQLRHLANTIPQLAWMAEPDGHVSWFNQGFFAYTGAAREQMSGWGWQSVVEPQALPAVLEGWRRSIATGEPFEMEFPLRGADGVFRWFLTRVNPMRDASGAVVRWFGTNTDVDQVRQIRHALEEETRILELLNRTGTTLAASLDQQSLVQTITDAATQLSGARFGAFFYNVLDEQGGAYMLYTLSGAPREAFENFGHPRATALFGPTFRGEAIIRCDDVRQDPRYGRMGPHHGMPTGHPPVRSYLAVPVISRSGEVIGGLFFGHPEPGRFTARTERLIAGVAAQAAVAIDNARLYEAAQKAAEDRKVLLESERHARSAAERASRMKDEFLTTLSHELRTPLSAILGWSHLLRAKPPGPEELSKGLETIERNARAQAQLIDDLLDMSRIASGKLRLDVQPVQPAAFVEEAMHTVRPAAEAKGIRLEKLLDPLAGPIYGDPSRLQQVIWNLLNNAIKFTPRAGKVQVVVERVGSHVEISVADTGAGIDPAFLEHVFERFRQADASTTRQYGGLGLGLAIVKHLVELHGGTVRADSPGTAQGSTFTVVLPLAVVHRTRDTDLRGHPTSPVPLQFEAADLSAVKVVVVDDQADARDLVARVLSECGAQVITAATAAEALLLVESERPHVLVTDIGMPDVDGFELLRRVRALGEARGREGAGHRAHRVRAVRRPHAGAAAGLPRARGQARGAVGADRLGGERGRTDGLAARRRRPEAAAGEGTAQKQMRSFTSHCWPPAPAVVTVIWYQRWGAGARSVATPPSRGTVVCRAAPPSSGLAVTTMSPLAGREVETCSFATPNPLPRSKACRPISGHANRPVGATVGSGCGVGVGTGVAAGPGVPAGGADGAHSRRPTTWLL